MKNYEILFKITYGLYAVCSGSRSQGNGFISNTVFQVASKPAKIALGCSKDNYTAGIIEKYGNFSVSILHQDTDSELFGILGYKSGKDINKLEGMKVKYGETGAPIILDDCIVYIECKVTDKFDVGSHWLFIGELVDAQTVDESAIPLTYDFYRKEKKGKAPKNAPTYIEESEDEGTAGNGARYKCAACGYIYDEEKEGVKFDDLPDDWKCPLCGTEKENFFKI